MRKVNLGSLNHGQLLRHDGWLFMKVDACEGRDQHGSICAELISLEGEDAFSRSPIHVDGEIHPESWAKIREYGYMDTDKVTPVEEATLFVNSRKHSVRAEYLEEMEQAA